MYLMMDDLSRLFVRGTSRFVVEKGEESERTLHEAPTGTLAEVAIGAPADAIRRERRA